MGYSIVDPDLETAGVGPHPAASPFDKRLGEQLGLVAFQAYFVALPPGETTVQHNHLEDQVEDLYVVVRGDGWLVVDGERVPVSPREFIAVTMESARQLVAGDDGLDVVAICSNTPAS